MSYKATISLISKDEKIIFDNDLMIFGGTRSYKVLDYLSILIIKILFL